MKKLIGKITNVLRENRILFLWILLFLLIGIVLGSYTVYYMGDYSKLEMGSYFNNFLEFMNKQEVNYKEVLFSSIKSIVPMVLIIIALGYTLIGFPFILLINLVKGYILGFSLSTIVTILGGKGIGVIFSTIIIQNLILIPIIILISIVAMKNSLVKFKSLGRDSKVNYENKGEYTMIQGILFLIVPIGIMIETYISPNLLKLVIK
ncbi:stage II sporulation protein M [Clostridium sp.]|uniref:stage II sporulation protein M n=1 Tax=Clostridium sp. TaxID=1506 RepID=UPI00399160D8